MKKFVFLTIIIVILSNLAIAQEPCLKIISMNNNGILDTLNIRLPNVISFGPTIAIANYGTKIVHDTVVVIKHDTVYVVKNDTGLVDSMNRLFCTKPWFMSRGDYKYNNGSWVTVPLAHCDSLRNDVYSADNTFKTYDCDGVTIIDVGTWSVSSDGKKISYARQGKPTDTIDINYLTSNEYQVEWIASDPSYTYRTTYYHK